MYSSLKEEEEEASMESQETELEAFFPLTFWGLTQIWTASHPFNLYQCSYLRPLARTDPLASKFTTFCKTKELKSTGLPWIMKLFLEVNSFLKSCHWTTLVSFVYYWNLSYLLQKSLCQASQAAGSNSYGNLISCPNTLRLWIMEFLLV